MIFVSLASGSAGNCTLVVSDKSKILIDCGISAKRAVSSLAEFGIKPEELDGVFVTHEHSDHIKGLKRLMSAYGVRIYGSEGTLGNLAKAAKDEYFNFAGADLMNAVSADRYVSIGDMRITPFKIWHDTAAPCAYRIDTDAASVCVLTDCGHYDDYIRDHMLGLDALLLEANHDRTMLVNGPYPMMLKRRVMSSTGHLCNNASGQLLSEIISPRLKQVFLGHLSKENNTPQTALKTVLSELKNNCGEKALSSLYINVAPQDGISHIAEL